MKNIGHVLYKKSKEPGTLKAIWCHSEQGTGTGIAIGDSTNGFEGHYQIRYFDNKGNLQAERELEIQKKDDCFKVYWFNNDEISAFGIGLENAEGLSVGYRDIETEDND